MTEIEDFFARHVETLSEQITGAIVLKRYHESMEPVRRAPEWLRRRMDALRAMPPPTNEEVKTQMEASDKYRREHGCD